MTIDSFNRDMPTMAVAAGSSGLTTFPFVQMDGNKEEHRNDMAQEGIRMENRDRAHGKTQARISSSNKQNKHTTNDMAQLRGEGHDFAELNTGERENGNGLDPFEQKEWTIEAPQVDMEVRNQILTGTDEGTWLHKCQHLQQGSLVCWENFLPKRQLKILLVEYDDATRHVVSALLRNCSYKVTAVANGLQAWGLLVDTSTNFDLVLTEVVIPYLSGIGLLCKITAHQALKDMPVIMMSSHDSMGIVFKCLSKGAVDFLVKPVRKNELKNLWQHVWRKWHTSSSSGNRSGHMHKVYEPKSEAGTGNNTGSNHESDNLSSSLNNGDGSDNGSGTQSSWTRRAVEVESPRFKNTGHPYFSIGQSMEVANGTIKSENCLHDVPCSKSYVMKINDQMGQHSQQIATLRPTTAVPKIVKSKNAPADSVCAVKEHAFLAINLESKQNGDAAVIQGTGFGECSSKTIDLIGGIGCEHKYEQGDNYDKGDKFDDDTNEPLRLKEEIASCSISLPALELSLKRPRPCGEADGDGGDRMVLGQSGCSAFSKYNTSGSCTQVPSPKPISTYTMLPGFRGLPFIQENNVGTSNTQFLMPAERARPGKNATILTPVAMHAQRSHGNDIEDIKVLPSPVLDGRALDKEENISLSQSGPSPIPFSGSSIQSYDGVPAAYGSLHPMFYSQCPAPPQGSTAPSVPDQGEAGNQFGHNKSQVLHPGAYLQSYNYNSGNRHDRHHHHHHVQHHHHHHHHYQNPSNSSIPLQDEQVSTVAGAGAPQCGSSNQVAGPEGNNAQSGSSNGYGSNGNGNGSVNGSAAGSNNGSSDPTSNGQTAAGLVVAGSGDCGAHIMNSGSGAPSNSMATGNACTGVAVCTDHNHVARREAALTKFRQKRKERCFEKKVRYQSRKRLAEQRPRVRGQFVRQSVLESTIGDCELDL